MMKAPIMAPLWAAIPLGEEIMNQILRIRNSESFVLSFENLGWGESLIDRWQRLFPSP
jgi:hypothetical protein